MFAVLVAGLYFSLCAYLVRLNWVSLYHTEQAYQSSLSRYPNGCPLPSRDLAASGVRRAV